MLDPSNVKNTTLALIIGLVGAAAIEAIWWVQGRILGEPRRVWAQR
jgi:cation-transporting ATPase E